ncbi:hypothetical protein [Arcicella rigui]|uniref:ABC transporter ATPase n=1 Tax=Arcicella rigui TaxID=797020 RepID=A0ABU5QGR9_9BACT|nr:hypothetical protein [Arcicella rigui]MEA5141747.1 hypothetical protein [Arcicella rigui]
MFIPFEKLPDYARVWVYQADKALNNAEQNHIQQVLEEQVNQWAAHGVPLVGSVQVLLNRFIIVAVDEVQNQASGCSIDASTRWLKELGAAMNLNFFDRSVAYVDGDEIKTVEMLKIKSLVAEGIIQADTIIFNNLVPNIGEFKTNWQVAASASWMKRYFQQVAL